MAFFDLDRTLIEVNSGFMWAQHERREGNISSWQFVRAAFWTGMYHFAFIDMETAMERALSHYRGVPERELDERTRAWFQRHIAGRVREGALRAIDDHRRQGHLLVILTSASTYEAAVAAETWDFDHYLANRFPVDAEGRLLGHFEAPLCYGPGKVTRAAEFAHDRGINLEDCFFYSDSMSDLPMLDAVSQPRVVCPDPRLKRLAGQRGWPILDW